MWRRLKVPARELRCDITLVCGQTFGWRPTGPREWTGVLNERVISLRQLEDDTEFCLRHTPSGTCSSPAELDTTQAMLREYLNLDACNLTESYGLWGENDPRFKRVAPYLPGIRMLRQDPWECMMSFICTSNNHISRITMMLDRLRSTYGTFLCDFEDQQYYTFPTIDELHAASEKELRGMGFGYRAKFVAESTKQVASRGGMDWLLSLRKADRDAVQSQLVELSGIGPKVADCIALFSLDKLDVVPVDTHVWQLVLKHYRPDLTGKSLTPRIYREVASSLAGKWGELAGWAHTVLFTAELRAFQDRLPEDLRAVPVSPRKKKAQGQGKAKKPKLE